jgi:nitrate/nitrite transport system ATP-binding protein
MCSMERYLELCNLKKTYASPAGAVDVVRDFNLIMHEGEFVCLIGHSGCGKSTVLAMVAGLIAKNFGSIIVAGREVRGAGPDRGMVFQSPSLLPWLSAFENVMLGVDQVFYSQTRQARVQIAEHYLSLVGLADAMHKKPPELSAGMRQRAGIARAFALAPKVLLLDEPFGMLDSLTRFELQQVLLDLWANDRKTALMVTHDVDEALFLSDRIAMMTSGPQAQVGQIMEVPFARPRDRRQTLDHPDYYRLREQLIEFLEQHAPHKQASAAISAGRNAAPNPQANLDLRHDSTALIATP